MPRGKANLNPLALGYSIAILGGIWMLVLGILGNLGYFLEAVEIMQAHHIFFSLSVGGIIAGIIEAAVFGLVAGYLFGWLYNKFI